MDFAWRDAQIAFKENVIAFAKRELNDDIIQRDHQGRFDRSLWQKCADFGIQSYLVPSTYMAARILTFLPLFWRWKALDMDAGTMD